MGDYCIEGLTEWFDYWDAWHKWTRSKPSPWHLIQYIKWLRSEPEYRKENNK